MLPAGMPAKETTAEPFVAFPLVPWQVAQVAETLATYSSSLLCADAVIPAKAAKPTTKTVANRIFIRLFIMLVSQIMFIFQIAVAVSASAHGPNAVIQLNFLKVRFRAQSGRSDA